MSNGPQKITIHAELENLESRITWGKRFAWFLVICGAIAAAWGLCVFYHDTTDSSFLEKLSAVGSYFQGAVGSLWALAGLMFIYVAFLGQRQQMLLQREEMEGQEKQFRLQQESIARQNFESAFFQLLNLHNQNVVQLRGTINGIERHGRACFGEWYNNIYKRDFRAWLTRNTVSDAKLERTASDYYLSFYKNNRANFAHYFRTLYHVFKFVKFGEIPDKEKKRYASLARAQLSANELAFLFYNGISPYGEKFKPLIEEFGLMEHLDKDKLLDPSHETFYDPKAFK
jgi:hypothetical protein